MEELKFVRPTGEILRVKIPDIKDYHLLNQSFTVLLTHHTPHSHSKIQFDTKEQFDHHLSNFARWWEYNKMIQEIDHAMEDI
jgi:hypothetical protein